MKTAYEADGPDIKTDAPVVLTKTFFYLCGSI